MVEKRYMKNLEALSEDDQAKLLESKVCVIGCGGLGGYIIEILSRLGVGTITAVDGDVFDETNLNRQILSEMNLIGKKKALAAQDRVLRVNPEVKLLPITEFVNRDNAADIIQGHDIVIDALDNPKDRLLIKDTCKDLDMILIHGAIGGWFGQVSVVTPDDTVLEDMYGKADHPLVSHLGNPSFVPPVVASIEVSECVKILTGKGNPLKGKVLSIDLLENEFEIINFGK